MLKSQLALWKKTLSTTNEPLEYLLNRGFTLETLDAFDIGYDDSRISKNYGRIIFPIKDVYGETTGIQARQFIKTEGDTRKFRITYGMKKTELLYGLYEAKHEFVNSNIGFLLEGNPDVLSMHELGYAAVANMGNSVSDYQAYLLARYTDNLILLPNNDKAGRVGTEQAKKLFKRFGVNVFTFMIPSKYNDINEFLVADKKGLEKWLTTELERL